MSTNLNYKSIFKNLSYTFSVNFLSLFISSLTTLILPKFLSITDYGYWQLYIFYSSYIGLLHFGIVDGIYLELGGEKLSDIDTKKYSNVFVFMLIQQVILAMLLYLFYSTNLTSNQSFVINSTLICMVISNIRLIYIYILQATNEIKKYVTTIVMEKVIYLFLILLIIFTRNYSYQFLIISDLVAKLISLIFVSIILKPLFKSFSLDMKNNLKEVCSLLSVGSKLMISNLSSMLIIGFTRFAIEKKWDVQTFGKLSLALNLSNILMVFINAMGIVIFPVIKRLKKEKAIEMYTNLRSILMGGMFIFLLFYYPVSIVIKWWLPQYNESINFLFLIFPICVFESKMSLLVTTYYKALREEKKLLKVNIVSLLLSIILTSLAYLFSRNLNIFMMIIMISMLFRSTYGETVLSKIIGIKLKSSMFIEILMVLLFIGTNYMFSSVVACFLYAMAITIYFLLDSKNISKAMRFLKNV